jgi:hypothetical protein
VGSPLRLLPPVFKCPPKHVAVSVLQVHLSVTAR